MSSPLEERAPEAPESGAPPSSPDSEGTESSAGAEGRRSGRAPGHLRLLALSAAGVLCLLVAAALLPASLYAWTQEAPRELGRLEDARLDQVGAPRSGVWVSGSGRVTGDGVSFSRQGAASDFVLTRLADRADLWLLLPQYRADQPLVPPAVLRGRLLRVDRLGFSQWPLAQVLLASGAKETDYLLLEAADPKSYVTQQLALVLLVIVGLSALGFSLYLGRSLPSAAESFAAPAGSRVSRRV